MLQSDKFTFVFERLSAEDIIFSHSQTNDPLKGNYIFVIDMYGINSENQINESKLIIGGKVFGSDGN